MFDLARAEFSTRIFSSRQLLAFVQPIELSKATEAATFKGLIFVHLYGAYEYVVRATVQAALSAIRRDGLSPRDIRQEVLTLVLDPHFVSASTTGRRRLWEKRIDLLATLDLVTPLQTFDDTLFPIDGSAFRVAQLYTIWRIFGIDAPIVPDNRYLGRIEELVENRHAIAHGRSTAEEVGRRYSTQEIEKRIDDVQAIAFHLLDTMKTHYESGALRR